MKREGPGFLRVVVCYLFGHDPETGAIIVSSEHPFRVDICRRCGIMIYVAGELVPGSPELVRRAHAAELVRLRGGSGPPPGYG